MKELVHSIRLEYGDTLFRLYQFQISKITNSGDDSSQSLHEHQFYELHLAFRGAHTYLLGTEQLSIRQGQMLLIPPDVPHLSVEAPCDAYDYTVLSFSLTKQAKEDGCFAYFRSTLEQAAKKPLTMSATLSARARELSGISLSQSCCSVRDVCAYKAKASALIYALFDSINGFHADHAPLRPSQDNNDRLVLLEALVNQPGRSLGEIATAIHYSPRHTARLIRSIYGMSLSELRRSQKQYL